MLLRRLDMSSFRAINQPRENPQTIVSGEQTVLDAVSQQNCQTEGGQASAMSPMPGADKLAATKKTSPTAAQSSPSLEAATTPRSPPSPLWNSPDRRKIYEEAEFVEIPKPRFDYEKAEKEWLAAKKDNLTRKAHKRSAEGEVKQNEPHKRQKASKSKRLGLEDRLITDDGEILNEEPQSSKQISAKQISAQRSPKGKSTEKQSQSSKVVKVNAKDQPDFTDVISHVCNEATSNTSERSNSEKVQPCSRPGAKTRNFQPPEGRLGKSHNKALRDSSGQNLRRAQSSISPRVFYGNQSRTRPTTNVGSSSHPLPEPKKALPSPGLQSNHDKSGKAEPPKDTINALTPRKVLPMQDRVQIATNSASQSLTQFPDLAAVDNSRDYLTPPNSSPLGKRRKADVPGHVGIYDDPVSEKETSGITQVSVFVPDTTGRCDQPPISLRNTTLNEQNASPPRAPQQTVNASQEASDNAILWKMRRTLATFKKRLKEDLPAAPQIQSAAVQPAPAPTTATTAPAQGGNRAGRVRTRKKKRRSPVEWELRFPELDRNVPRLPDEDIIRVGRIVNFYQRHQKAPYAFSRRGRLRLGPYKYLLARHRDGVPGWTADEISRLTR